MISYTKDEYDRIVSFLEWQVVNKDGKNENGGEYIYIQDAWCHKDCSLYFELPELILNILKDKFSENARYVYWCRFKYGERQKIYSIEDFFNKFVKGVHHGK